MENKCNRKPKISIPEQVEYMKNNCGIKFDICSEEDAKNFLEQSTYFFKIKAFAKCFNKYGEPPKYINLDFAYLVELSTLDMLLRKITLSMALDIEHFLKVKLIKHLSANNSENGYKIVESYFTLHPTSCDEIGIHDRIKAKSKNSMCADLVNKLEKDGYSLWNTIEVMSFGDFIQLFKIYAQNYNEREFLSIANCLFPIKCIRNAAAHNNCLLNSLCNPYSSRTVGQEQLRGTEQIRSTISKISNLGKSKSLRYLDNPVIHDFITTIVVFDRVVTSTGTKQHTYNELHKLFHERMTKNKNYFVKNEKILAIYNFVVKIVDFYYNRAYNISAEQKQI